MRAAQIQRHVLVACGMLLALPGCYDKTEHAGSSVYKFSPWLVACAFVSGFAFMALGWMLRRGRSITSDRGLFGYLLLGLAGPTALAVLAPSLYCDRVIVSDSGVQVATGFWCAQTLRSIRFDDLAGLKLVAKRNDDPRNPGRLDRELVCVRKDSSTRVVPVGDLLRMALEEVLQKAQARGVKVSHEDRSN